MASPENNHDQLSWQDLQAHALWWVRLFYEIFLFFWRVLWRHWKLSFSCMAIFASLLIAKHYSIAQEYQMTSTFVYGDLHPKVFGDMIAKLNALVSNKAIEQVGSLLQLDTQQVKKINWIGVVDSRGKSLVDNYTMHKEPMIITVNMASPIASDSLHMAISSYLNSNPFTASRLDMKKRLLEEELVFINQKQQTIDTVLKQLYENPSSPKTDQGTINIENSEGKNAYDLLRFSRELIQRKAEIENSLVQIENVFAIDNFIVLPRAKFDLGTIIKKTILGGIMGLILASLVVFWQDYLRKWVNAKHPTL
ncbi:MAG: hypothetical protein R2828_03025 [Saprospiraceae bacterium]